MQEILNETGDFGLGLAFSVTDKRSFEGPRFAELNFLHTCFWCGIGLCSRGLRFAEMKFRNVPGSNARRHKAFIAVVTLVPDEGRKTEVER